MKDEEKIVKGAVGLGVGFVFDQFWYPVTNLPIEEFIGGRTLCDVVEIGLTSILIVYGLLDDKEDIALMGVGFGAGALLSTLKQLGKI